jgi:4-oxalocrotonate tautomerase
MPLAKLHVPAHLPLHTTRQLADAVHAALVQTCAVPAGDRFQLVLRLPPDGMLLDASFGGVSRGPDACIVEIAFLQGRTDDQKRALYRAIAEGAQDSGMRPDDVMVALLENDRIDWSLGRGQAYVDVH